MHQPEFQKYRKSLSKNLSLCFASLLGVSEAKLLAARAQVQATRATLWPGLSLNAASKKDKELNHE